MEYRRPVIFLLIILVIIPFANAGKLKRIKRAIRKHKFEKAERLVHKMLDKDSINPGAKYFYSVMFSDTSYYRYDIDSARFYINEGYDDYQVTPVDELKDLRKVDLTKLDFIKQKDFVADLAFERARGKMTVDAFQLFLDRYPDALSEVRNNAITYRDSLAFEEAKGVDTWESYKVYFEKYPESAYVSSARDRYHVLIFEDYTKDGGLDGYVRFLDDHPDTPFRNEAEKIILKRSTIDNTWESYRYFMERYPESYLLKQAGDILYYQALQHPDHTWEEVARFHVYRDSLETMHHLNSEVLFPVSEGGLFGFMNLSGTERVPMKYERIPDRYLCGGIRESWLEVVTDDGVKAITRDEKLIGEGLEEFVETGTSTILTFGENGGLFHKSGYRLADNVDEAKELNNGWIAYAKNDLWGVMTPAAYRLMEPQVDQINTEGAFFVLEKDGFYAVTNNEEMKAEAFEPEFLFDDYEVINDTLFQGFSGDEECLIAADLQYLRSLSGEAIYVSDSFWYQKGADGYQIFDIDDKEIMGQTFEYLEVNAGWLTLKKPNEWLLISRKPKGVLPINDLDSVKLISDNAAYIQKGDSLQVVFQNGRREWVQKGEQIQVLTSNDYEYILFSTIDLQQVFDPEGEMLFDTRNENLTLLSDTLFKFKRRGKVGVLSRSGELIISAKYDVIDQQGPLLFLLDGEQIGSYDLENEIKIPVDYDARITKVGLYYQVQSGSKIGLVDKSNNEVLPIEFSEVKQWNDTSFWARNDEAWQLITSAGDVLLDNVISMSTWLEQPDETYAMILEKEGHGLLSNRNGVILVSEYNEIINVGSQEEPIIFAEQHLKAAAFYVVTYFTVKGGVIKSQAFRPEDYNNIYCDQ